MRSGRRGQVDGDAQLVRLRRWCARAPSTARSMATRRDPACDRSSTSAPSTTQRCAGVHRGRRVHDVAADGADVAGGRRADQRAGVGERRVAVGEHRVVSMTWCDDERADAITPSVVLHARGQLVDAVDGHHAVGQRRLALTGTDHEVAAAGDRARAGGQRGERFVDVSWRW